MATTRKKSGVKKSGTAAKRPAAAAPKATASKAGASKAAKPSKTATAKATKAVAGTKAAASKPAASRPAASPRAATAKSASKPAATKSAASKSTAPAKPASPARVPAPARATKEAAAPKVRATRVPKRESTATAASQRVALAVAEAALDKKAVNVEIIDVAGKVDYADYVVVMSGTSDRQVNALARGIAEDVETKTRNKCLGVEGLPGGAWVLMDFGDVVVHIFHHDVRGYYDLESLWIDAARLPVPGVPAS